MKYLYFTISILITSALILNDRSKGFQVEERNQYVASRMNYTVDLVGNLEFKDCDEMQAYFRYISNKIGCVLIIDDHQIRMGNRVLMGETSGDTIWLYASLCSGQFVNTFFHEVGHVLLHYDGIKRTRHVKEEEAILFADSVVSILINQ